MLISVLSTKMPLTVCLANIYRFCYFKMTFLGLKKMAIFKLIFAPKWQNMPFSTNHSFEILNYRDMKLIEVMSLLKCLRKNYTLEYNFLISCILKFIKIKNK